MSKEIKPQSACKRFQGKKLGKNEYWSPNLFTSDKIETMDMDTGFIEEEFQEELKKYNAKDNESQDS